MYGVRSTGPRSSAKLGAAVVPASVAIPKSATLILVLADKPLLSVAF
jgi:hypothetical protein